MSATRAKPESARSTIFTRGQRARIRPAMRWTSSTAPALASMLERRSLAAKIGGQEMPAAEDVERQGAVAIIVAMEKAAFLMDMDRVIGRVQVQNDLARGLCPKGAEEEVDEHGLDRSGVMPDLVIAPARGLGRRMLQPVERALAGQ